MKKYTDDVLSLPMQFRKDWARKLRSGEMEQTDGVLFDGYRYCCLGVAGAVRGIDHDLMRGAITLMAKSYGLRSNAEFNPDLISGENIKYVKSIKLKELADVDLEVWDNWLASECNDELALSFSQIADLIYQEPSHD